MKSSSVKKESFVYPASFRTWLSTCYTTTVKHKTHSENTCLLSIYNAHDPNHTNIL